MKEWHCDLLFHPLQDTIRVEFEKRLSETILWCNRRLNMNDLRNSFRTEDLRPGQDVNSASIVGEHRLRSLVDDVATKRDRRLAGILDRPVPGDLMGGKLLVYAPSRSLAEGHAALVTGGFFDVDESPPWDTWIWMQTGPSKPEREEMLLACWVPHELINVVQAGIDVQSADWMRWLESY